MIRRNVARCERKAEMSEKTEKTSFLRESEIVRVEDGAKTCDYFRINLFSKET